MKWRSICRFCATSVAWPSGKAEKDERREETKETSRSDHTGLPTDPSRRCTPSMTAAAPSLPLLLLVYPPFFKIFYVLTTRVQNFKLKFAY